MRSRFILAAAAAVALAALAGCSANVHIGGSDTVKQSDEVSNTKNFLSSKLPDLPPVKTVDCPGGVSTDVGTTFSCSATLTNGQKVTVPLVVKTSSGSGGTLGSDPKIVDNALAVDLLYRGAQKPVKVVDCPTDVPAKVGRTFTCKTAFEDGSTTTVLVRMTNAAENGNQHLAIAGAKKTS
jgi:Domain of unknown function (DUF4333)